MTHQTPGKAATALASAGSSSGETPILLSSPLTFPPAHIPAAAADARVTLLGQALGDAQPVDGVHPREMVRHQAPSCCSAGADEMPLEAQVCQGATLTHTFRMDSRQRPLTRGGAALTASAGQVLLTASESLHPRSVQPSWLRVQSRTARGFEGGQICLIYTLQSGILGSWGH